MERGRDTEGPRTTPLRKAGREPVGASEYSWIGKAIDVFVVIIVPIALPGLLLTVARGQVHGHGGETLTLPDIAFGFVAVTVACTARAIALKSVALGLVAVVAVLVVGAQTGLAVNADTEYQTSELVRAVESSHDGDSSQNIRQLAASVDQKEPTSIQWGLSVFTGILVVVASFELIRRDL